MNDLDKLMIERECERLVITYTHFVDFGEASKIADLFTEDGVWEGPGIRFEGIEQIRTSFIARQKKTDRRSRHVCTNFGLTEINEDSAKGVVYLTLYRQDDTVEGEPASIESPVVIGQYHDQFRKTEAGWRISHRRVGVAFAHVSVSEAR